LGECGKATSNLLSFATTTRDTWQTTVSNIHRPLWIGLHFGSGKMQIRQSRFKNLKNIFLFQEKKLKII